jgi:hypothetical protein
MLGAQGFIFPGYQRRVTRSQLPNGCQGSMAGGLHGGGIAAFPPSAEGLLLLGEVEIELIA